MLQNRNRTFPQVLELTMKQKTADFPMDILVNTSRVPNRLRIQPKNRKNQLNPLIMQSLRRTALVFLFTSAIIDLWNITELAAFFSSKLFRFLGGNCTLTRTSMIQNFFYVSLRNEDCSIKKLSWFITMLILIERSLLRPCWIIFVRNNLNILCTHWT